MVDPVEAGFGIQGCNFDADGTIFADRQPRKNEAIARGRSGTDQFSIGDGNTAAFSAEHALEAPVWPGGFDFEGKIPLIFIPDDRNGILGTLGFAQQQSTLLCRDGNNDAGQGGIDCGERGNRILAGPAIAGTHHGSGKSPGDGGKDIVVRLVGQARDIRAAERERHQATPFPVGAAVPEVEAELQRAAGRGTIAIQNVEDFTTMGPPPGLGGSGRRRGDGRVAGCSVQQFAKAGSPGQAGRNRSEGGIGVGFVFGKLCDSALARTGGKTGGARRSGEVPELFSCEYTRPKMAARALRIEETAIAGQPEFVAGDLDHDFMGFSPPNPTFEFGGAAVQNTHVTGCEVGLTTLAQKNRTGEG